MKVVIRADATETIGAGHVMRCWALAEELASRGAKISWQGRFDVPWLRMALARSGWEVLTAAGSGSDQAAAVAADMAVVDTYDLSHDYRLALMDRGIPVIAIVDDSVADLGPASLWINPGAKMSGPVASGDTFLNGPDFVLIRREVRDLQLMRERLMDSGSSLKGITFLLGGTDFADLSRLVNAMSLHIDRSWRIGAGPSRGDHSCADARIHWTNGGSSLLQQAAKSLLAVSTAGVTSWELAHIGVPLALLQVADNQRGNYVWMTEQSWAWPLGIVDLEADMASLAKQLPHVFEAFSNGVLMGQPRIDGLGAMRVADGIVRLLG